MNEEIADFCGIKIGANGCSTMGVVKYPDGTIGDALPDFEHDWNACEKWIIPELSKRDCDVIISFTQGVVSVEIETTRTCFVDACNTVPKTFCNAVMKLIKETK